MTSPTTESLPNKRIPVIGIVGGIGSGKTAVAEWVGARTNSVVINADTLGHEALRSAPVKQSLCERFGRDILGPDAEIVRAALAKKVFGESPDLRSARRDLEQIVHPEIGRRIQEQIASAAAENREAVFLDAAVMLEAGWRPMCDCLVFIDTPDAIRLARVQQRSGWSEQELEKREASQLSLHDKRERADLIITNDRDLATAGQQLLDRLIEKGLIKSRE